MAVALAAILPAACDVEWAGARVDLEDPAPPADTAAAADRQPDHLPPLPEGPFLHLVEVDPDGAARLVPVARLDGGLQPLTLPDSVDDAYASRFRDAFLPVGSELSLHAGGRRSGSVILEEPTWTPRAECLPVAGGRALLLPGTSPPRLAFAVPVEVGGGPVSAEPPALEPTRGMNVAAPVLAERHLDDPRAYLARRVGLTALRLPGDTAAAMAATFLVADSLAPGPPPGEAMSLFFVARPDPERGFRTVWSEVRRYATAEEKEAFLHLDWVRVGGGRVDVLQRVDGSRLGLAASYLPEGAEADAMSLTWREEGPCRGPELLREAREAGLPTAAGG